MTNESLYQKSYILRIPEIGKLAPDTFKAFLAFDRQALAEGMITKKTKELIAVAVAHVTGCPYCINDHVSGARKLEASKEEITEAVIRFCDGPWIECLKRF